MTRLDEIPWSRIIAEGGAIIVGILLAFSIDAWWEGRQQRAGDLTHLQGVLEELESHKVLLAEAIESHRSTVDLGYELFELLASDQSPAQKERTTEVIDLMANFYRINAPFGSLQTAMSSGAMARMQDVDLASAIASWPTTIEDLLEEENNAATIIILDHYARLGQKLSLHEVYGHRLANPTGRGTPGVVDEVARPEPPRTHLSVDYKVIEGDVETRNGFLRLMMFGQAALAEATLANAKLEALIGRLGQCIDQGGC